MDAFNVFTLGAARAMRFVVLLSTTAAPSAFGQSNPVAVLDSLRALSLDSIPGIATVFFRVADRARATSLQRELERGLTFFRRTQSVETQLRLAVLQPNDWTRLTTLPYGFPNNIGPPANLILAPAS